jgi:predicted O-methyltransferase YrrM
LRVADPDPGARFIDFPGRRCVIEKPTLPPAVREFTESYVAEDAVFAAARGRAAEVGIMPIQPGGGATLRLLATAIAAKSVVEVGTGAGVSGLWLLYGMRPDGVLTTIDIEPEHQRIARKAFTEAGFPPGRTRLIAGRALEVLPRLTDGAYDMVVVGGDKSEFDAYVREAYRLLRVGGVLAVDNALGGGKVVDPAARDPESVALREVVKSLRDTDEWTSALLPVGDGLLIAVKR